jgi:class 3 adenylate cyclase
MRIPETRYADAGDTRIAYQLFGEGPPVLIVSGLLSNVELVWEHELFRRTFERIGKHVTCLVFDKRGVGLSDRFDSAPTSEQRLGDMLSVLEAVGWDRAHVHGMSEGGLMAQHFAAEHPDRVMSLGLLNSGVPRRYFERVADYVRPSDRVVASTVPRLLAIAESWPSNPADMVDMFLPSQSGNDSVVRWFGRLQRLSASPRDFRRQLESVFAIDPGDAPERVRARTQVMHTAEDDVIAVATGRLLADVIPNAEFVEIPGGDHFAWCMPNWSEMLDRYLGFVLGETMQSTAVRRFATVLFTDIVNSTSTSASVGDTRWRELLESHDRIVRRLIEEHHGTLIKSSGDGLLAMFDLPSEAVGCGAALLDELSGIGVVIRAGVHAGEVEVREDGDITGIAVNLAARVEHEADAGTLWATSTVRDMMLGGSVQFLDQGEHALKGIDGAWRLYRLAKE